LAYCFVMPAQFAAFCAFGMVAMAVVRGFTSRGEAGGMLDTILLWLGSCALAILMIVVTLASAAVLGMGVTTGSLCLDPGAALLGILQNAADPAPSPGTLEAAKYYLVAGGGHAPAAVELDACRRRIDSVHTEMVSNQRHLDMLALVCDPVHRMNLSASVHHLQHATNEAINLLSRDTVLGHYHQVVTGVICGSAFEALAWLTIFQVFIGLVCLPLISVLTNSFMSDNSAQLSPDKRFVGAPADEYARLHESSMLLGTGDGHQLSGGPHPHFLQSPNPEAFGSGFSPMRAGDHGSAIVSAGPQAWATGSRTGTFQSVVSDPGLPQSPWPVAGRQVIGTGMSPRAERRVHFADENGGSLFGSQNMFSSKGVHPNGGYPM
jgi:hypothetical protein